MTRWQEDMNFMFEWQEQYLTRSLNDTTLTKVTYGKYATRVPDEVRMASTSGLVPSKTLSSI